MSNEEACCAILESRIHLDHSYGWDLEPADFAGGNLHFFGIFYGSFMGMVCHQQSKNLLELAYEEVVIYIIQKKKIKKMKW